MGVPEKDGVRDMAEGANYECLKKMVGVFEEVRGY